MAKKHSNANRQKRQKKAAAKKTAAAAASTTAVAPTKEETVIVEQHPDVTVGEQQPVDDASKITPVQEEIKEKDAPAASEEPPVSVAESKGDKEVVNDEQPTATDVAGDKNTEKEEAPTTVAAAAEPVVPEAKQEANTDPVPTEEIVVVKEQVPVEIVPEKEPVSAETKDTPVIVEQVKPEPVAVPVVAEPIPVDAIEPAAVVETAKAPSSSNNAVEVPRPQSVAEENNEAIIAQEPVTVSTKDETVSPPVEVQEEETDDDAKVDRETVAVSASSVASETTETGTEIKAPAKTKDIVTEEVKAPAVAKKAAVEKTFTSEKKTVASREINSFEEKRKKKFFGLFSKKGKDQKSKVATSNEKQKSKRKVWQFWKSS